MMFRLILQLTAGVTCAQSPPELAQGQALLETYCALCHGVNGKGSRGPSLTKSKLAKAADDAALKKLVENGLEPEMPGSWFLTEPLLLTSSLLTSSFTFAAWVRSPLNRLWEMPSTALTPSSHSVAAISAVGLEDFWERRHGAIAA